MIISSTCNKVCFRLTFYKSKKMKRDKQDDDADDNNIQTFCTSRLNSIDDDNIDLSSQILQTNELTLTSSSSGSSSCKSTYFSILEKIP